MYDNRDRADVTVPETITAVSWAVHAGAAPRCTQSQFEGHELEPESRGHQIGGVSTP